MLHTLWSKAVGTLGYVKEEWMEMEREIIAMKAELAALREQVRGHSDRIAKQSELLSNRAKEEAR